MYRVMHVRSQMTAQSLGGQTAGARPAGRDRRAAMEAALGRLIDSWLAANDKSVLGQRAANRHPADARR